MKTDKLVYEKQGNTGVITFNNPPANTWTEDSLKGLSTLIADLNADKDIYAIVLRSNSDKFFSAGADLALFSNGDLTVSQNMANAFGDAFEALSNFRGVSIAAINGFAMGGGLEVALACDIRVAEEHAQLALPEAKVGLLPCAGGTQNLTMLVGEGWAKRIILCGERISGSLAQEIGLVEEVVEKGTSFAKAMELANAVAQQSPTSVTACKKLIQNHRDNPWSHGYVQERIDFVELFHSEDQKEGVNAFLDKRKPVWKNQ